LIAYLLLYELIFTLGRRGQEFPIGVKVLLAVENRKMHEKIFSILRGIITSETSN
jgi:hypothetical protein